MREAGSDAGLPGAGKVNVLELAQGRAMKMMDWSICHRRKG